MHARGVALSPNVDLRTIAARTPGFTGADLENVVNEAALLAARREKNAVTMDELEEAIDRASMGLERKSRVMSPKEKRRVASHEMGHALVAHYSENLDPVHRITIIPRGTAALGLTMTRPLEDRFLAPSPSSRTRSPTRWAAASPRSSSTARSPRAPRTTWRRPRRSRARWSPSTA